MKMKTKIKKKEAEMKKREGGGKGRMRESEGVDERKKSERMGEVSDAIIIRSTCTVQPEIASRFCPNPGGCNFTAWRQTDRA